MTPPPASEPSWSTAPAWRELFDLLSDAVVVLDAQSRVAFANSAAVRLMPCEAGTALDHLQAALGAEALRWIRHALLGAAGSVPPPLVHLADGRTAALAWRRLDPVFSALRLQLGAGTPPAPGPDSGPVALRETVRLFWDSPFPVTLQDADFRLVDVNPAYLEFSGYSRDKVIGLDPSRLQPEEDRAETLALRELLRKSAGKAELPALIERRIMAANGRERWFRAARRSLLDEDGRQLYLAVLQDTTAEHAARETADRSVRELDGWFDLSPVGMVLFDYSGLLVRSNPAFEALAGTVPVMLGDAPANLQQLLAWHDGAVLPALQPGASALEVQGWADQAGGGVRRLRSIVRCYKTLGGQHRYMAVVEDRSAEEERDLAQMQIGAMMETAGVGLATFQESSGWVHLTQLGSATAAPSAVLQTIHRDIVNPESLPEFERLQAALRHAQRAEVRYAIRHPELGQRWLLTRVEPATLASGKRTTSVVTLDVTEQHQAQLRSEQLLLEMTTILESTTAGIAYLRGDLLLRCNRRFEVMLGLRAGSVAGCSVQGLFGTHPQGQRIAAETRQALARGAVYETEFEVGAQGARAETRRWYALSVRRTAAALDPIEAIAVLSDITRLKTQQMELEILARDRELMFSLSEVGITFVRDGRIQRANDAMALLTGYSVAELSTLELAALFPDAADFKRRWPQEERDLRVHGRWSGERPLRQRDGRLVRVQASKRLVNAGDPAGGIIASYVNVDARHRAEQSVALQAERTRAILDSVLVGIVTVGPFGIEWMNRSARRMFGGDLADFIKQPISTVATPEPEHPFRQTHYLNDLVEGQAETFECRVKARDGREFWVVGNAVATARESTGRQLTYALLDIERRRQAEARMSEARTSLQRIIEAAPMAITLRDASTLRIVQVNQVASKMFYNLADEPIGRTPEELFSPSDAAARRLDMEEALASREVTQREYRVVNEGETRVWDARYLPLAAGPGEPPDQLLLVATDVTEQRAAQEARLEAAIAQRDMLVKEVHHRIKNNLQGVAGLLQQIAQRKPEVAGVISEVVGQVQAIAQVYGLQVGVSGPLHLRSVVEAITASVQRTFGRTIRFEVTGAAPERWALPEAESIPIALTINELLTNAIKHSLGDAPGEPSAREVWCTLACDEDGVSLVIANPAMLPSGFNLARIPGGVSGLGLVRALLPRRSAGLTIEQQGGRVVATVALQPPGVTRLPAS